MGLDLTLLPFNHESPDKSWGFSHTMLPLDRSGLLEAVMRVEKAKGSPVPKQFQSYTSRDESCSGDPHYGNTQDTPYGEALLCVEAQWLVPLIADEGRHSSLNRATWAYLKELPATTKVALYWH